MKKKFLPLLLALSIFISVGTPRKADAIILGAATGGVGAVAIGTLWFVLGGVNFAVQSHYPGPRYWWHYDNMAYSLIFMVAGLALNEQEAKTAASQLRPIDYEAELAGYPNADRIIADLKVLDATYTEPKGIRVDVSDATPEEAITRVQKALNLQEEGSAKYLLARGGFQVER